MKDEAGKEERRSADRFAPSPSFVFILHPFLPGCPPCCKRATRCFPTGAYAHSGGLETLVELGVVKDAPTLSAFLRAACRPGAGTVRVAVPAVCASVGAGWRHRRSVGAGPRIRRGQAAARNARGQRAPRHPASADVAESHAEGRSLRRTMATRFLALVERGDAAGHAAIVCGVQAAWLNVPADAAATAYFYGSVSGYCSAALKLIRIGQEGCQAALADALTLAERTVRAAGEVSREDAGWCDPAVGDRRRPARAGVRAVVHFLNAARRPDGISRAGENRNHMPDTEIHTGKFTVQRLPSPSRAPTAAPSRGGDAVRRQPARIAVPPWPDPTARSAASTSPISTARCGGSWRISSTTRSAGTTNFFRTLEPLFKQPGFLTLEFMAGRRVRYVHPLRLFLFTSAVCLALLQFCQSMTDLDNAANKPAAKPSDGGASQNCDVDIPLSGHDPMPDRDKSAPPPRMLRCPPEPADAERRTPKTRTRTLDAMQDRSQRIRRDLATDAPRKAGGEQGSAGEKARHGDAEERWNKARQDRQRVTTRSCEKQIIRGGATAFLGGVGAVAVVCVGIARAVLARRTVIISPT